MDEFLYNELNKAWKTTCKVLFKEEIGELKEYEEWLVKDMEFLPVKKGGVFIGAEYKNMKSFIDYKSTFSREFEPLNINEIKDIDSIVEALKERIVSVGNIIYGRSKNVGKSTEIGNSFNVLSSRGIYNSKNIAYSSWIRDSSYTFSCHYSADINFSVKTIFCGGTTNHRMFNTYMCIGSSDVYYSSNIMYSNNVMFSFGIENESYYIGNIKLPKDKYLKLKEKLLHEISSILEDKKQIFSIVGLLNKPLTKEAPKIKLEFKEEYKNKEIIEKAFKDTTKLLLKKPLENLDVYENFLTKNLIDKGKETFSPLSKRKIIYLPKMGMIENPERMVEWEEVFIVSKKIRKEIKDLDEINDFEFFFSTDAKERCHNIIDSACPYRAKDCYKVADAPFTEKSAFSVWARNSTHMFGCFITHKSSFCINTNNSFNVNRTFETTLSYNSNDLTFCHGLSDCNNCIFSFGIAGKSYAIGNAKYEREKYLKIKESLLEQIGNELEEKKDLKWSIYNIGSGL